MAFKLTYKGKDLGVFDADEVSMNEAIQLEEQTGLTINEMINGVGRSAARATQALMWFQSLRKGTPIDLHEDFKFGDFDVDPIVAADPTPAPVIELPGADHDSPSKTAGRGGSRTSRTISA